MARKALKGLDYTYFDITFFQDRKIRRLQRRCGGQAPMVYLAILCAIYKEGYYIEYDDDFILDIADETKMEEDYISEVIRECVEVMLFDRNLFEKFGIISSRGIQKQYKFITEKSKRKSNITEYSLIDDENCDQEIGEIETDKFQYDGINSKKVGRNSKKREEIAEFKEEMPEKREEMQHIIEYNRIEYNNKFSFSSLSSFSSDKEIEKQQQKDFILAFFFFQNFSNPEKELERFIDFNNTGGRCWEKMSWDEKQAAARLWTQKPVKPPRFAGPLLAMWQKLVSLLPDIKLQRMALSDSVAVTVNCDTLIINCQEELKEHIEDNLNQYGKLIRKTMKQTNTSKLIYHCNYEDQG